MISFLLVLFIIALPCCLVASLTVNKFVLGRFFQFFPETLEPGTDKSQIVAAHLVINAISLGFISCSLAILNIDTGIILSSIKQSIGPIYISFPVAIILYSALVLCSNKGACGRYFQFRSHHLNKWQRQKESERALAYYIIALPLSLLIGVAIAKLAAYFLNLH